MDGLCSTDEAHRGEAVPPSIETFMSGPNHRWMFRQPEVIVGAHVDDFRPAGHPDVSVLGSGKDAFVLVETLTANLSECRSQLFSKGLVQVRFSSRG